MDWLGAGLLSPPLAAVLLGVSQAGRVGLGVAGEPSPAVGGGILLMVAFVAVEGRVNQPLIDLEVLKKPAVAATNLTGFLVGLAMFSSFLSFPQFAPAPESTGYGFGLHGHPGRPS